MIWTTFVSQIETTLNLYDPGINQIVIVHFAEKGNSSDIISHCPNPAYTYNLTKAGFAGKEAWVIPELEGNQNLTARCEWLAENFNGIPVVIDAFEGGSNPTPMVMLSTADLEQIMQVANVTAIRIPELISWYMGRNITDPTAWTGWVQNTFNFALSHDLKIFWSEWKIGSDIEEPTNVTLAGYEDKITRLYQTNNQYQHPQIGYGIIQTYPHWGASVQSWWVDENNVPHYDLPLEYVELYATLARNMGARVIQFEPYWYFFDETGEPTETMYAMWSII